jgi:hypothetical protein
MILPICVADSTVLRHRSHPSLDRHLATSREAIQVTSKRRRLCYEMPDVWYPQLPPDVGYGSFPKLRILCLSGRFPDHPQTSPIT